MHLLAAEDNELNAEIVEMLLTDDGAKVTVAKNGRQAVEYFESNSPGTFDAILMDVMMPVMDGIAATKAIRAMDRADAKTIPIIAMTANAFEEDAKRCLAAGMTAADDDHVINACSFCLFICCTQLLRSSLFT